MIDLRKMIKISTCVLGLSVMIVGFNTFATENGENDLELLSSSDSSGLNQAESLKENVIDSKIDEGESEIYSKYYAHLLIDCNVSEENAKKIAELYESYIKKNKSELYADYCSRLVIERKENIRVAEKLAEKYEKNIKSSKDIEYSNYSAYLSNCVGIKKLKKTDVLHIYEKKKIQGHSDIYSRYFSSFMDNSSLCEEEIDKKCRIYEEIYNQQIISGKGKHYAEHYADLIAKGKVSKEEADSRATIYERELSSGNSELYSEYYAKLIVNENKDERSARIQAKGYLNIIEHFFNLDLDSYMLNSKKKEKTEYILDHIARLYLSESEFLERMLADGRLIDDFFGSLEALYNKDYFSIDKIFDIVFHSRSNLVMNNMDGLIQDTYYFGDGYEELYNRLIENNVSKSKADYMARMYLQMKDRKGKMYAKYYLGLILGGNIERNVAEKQANLYVKEIENGKGEGYADYYARSLMRNFKEKDARDMAEVYELELDNSGDKDYADYYTMSVFEKIFTRDESGCKLERKIKAYDYEKELNPDEKNMDYYVNLLIDEEIDRDKAKEMLNMYNEEIRLGKSKLYADYYVRLVSEGERKELARRMALTYESEIQRGKDEIYADYYARLINERNLSEIKARIMADKYKKKVNEGKSKAYSECYIALTEISDLNEREAIEKLKEISAKGREYLKYVSSAVDEDIPFTATEAQVDMFFRQSKEMGMNSTLSDIYAFFSIYLDASREQADLFVKEHGKELQDKDRGYINIYIKLIAKGYRKNIARMMTEIVVDQMKNGREERYAIYYASLIINERKSKEDAEKQTKIYKETIDSHKGIDFKFADVCATFCMKYNKDVDVMEQANAFMRKYYESEMKEWNRIRKDLIDRYDISGIEAEFYTDKYMIEEFLYGERIASCYIRELLLTNKNDKEIRELLDFYSNGDDPRYFDLYKKYGKEYGERWKNAYEGKVRKGNSEQYSMYYADIVTELGIDEENASNMAAIYEAELPYGGKSYAHYYAFTRVINGIDEDKARLQAEIYVKERKFNKYYCETEYLSIDELANEYAYRRINEGMNEGEARLKALLEELYTYRIFLNVKNGRKNDFIYDNLSKCKLISMNNYRFMKNYISVEDRIKIYGDFFKYKYNQLISDDKMDKISAEREANVYAREIVMRDKDEVRSSYYADLIVKNGMGNWKAIKKAEAYCDLFKKETETSKLPEECIKYYAKLVVGRNLPEELARRQANVYYEKLTSGRSRVYSDCYAYLSVNENISGQDAERISTIYEENIARNWKYNVNGDTNLFMKEFAKSYDQHYANYYSDLILKRNLTEKQADIQIGLYKGEIERHKSNNYADYYATLVAERGLNEAEARRMADKYEVELELSNEDLAHYYIELVIEKKMTNELAEEQLKVYKDELKRGKSKEYAKYYANLIVKERLDKASARRQANIYYDLLRSGENKQIANCYAVFRDYKKLELVENLVEECRKQMEYRNLDEKCISVSIRAISELMRNNNYELNPEYSETFFRSDVALAKGKSEEFAYFYSKFYASMDDHKDGLCSLKESAQMYAGELNRGRSQAYAECYAISKYRYGNEELSRKIAEIYEKAILEFKDTFKAFYYATSLCLNDIDEEIAHHQTDVYIDIASIEFSEERRDFSLIDHKIDYAAKVSAEKNIKNYDEYGQIVKRIELKKEKEERGNYSEVFADYYAYLVTEKGIKNKKAEKLAKIYEKEIEAGRKKFYADGYAHLILEKNLSNKEARSRMEEFQAIYDKGIELGKSKRYMDYYIGLMIKEGLDEEKAEQMTSHFINMIKRRESYFYSDYYARLITDLKLDRDEVLQRTKEYNLKIREGKNNNYSHWYSYFLVTKGTSIEIAERLAQEFSDTKAKNEDYLNYFMILASEDEIEFEKMRKLAEAYQEGMEKTKDHIYSDYYAFLIVDREMKKERAEEVAMRYVKIYNDELGKGESGYYSEYYADAILNDMGEKDAEIKAKEYESMRIQDFTKYYSLKYIDLRCNYLAEGRLKKCLDLFGQMIRTKSYAYASYYLDLMNYDRYGASEKKKAVDLYIKMINNESDEYSRYYSKLVALDNINEEDAKVQAKTYIAKLKSGKSYQIADCYAKLVSTWNISPEKIENILKIYEEELTKCSSDYYALYYAKLIVNNDMDKERARLQSEEYKKMILLTNDHHYSDYYANLKTNSKIYEEDIIRMARIYSDKIKDGQSQQYAECCSILMVLKGLNPRQVDEVSRIYEKALKKYRNSEYALNYSMFMYRRNQNDETSIRMAEKYANKILQTNNHNYAYYYAMIEECGTKDIERQQIVYEKKMAEGKSAVYSYSYAYSVVKNSLNDNEADEIASECEKRRLENPRYIVLVCGNLCEQMKTHSAFKKNKM